MKRLGNIPSGAAGQEHKTYGKDSRINFHYRFYRPLSQTLKLHFLPPVDASLHLMLYSGMPIQPLYTNPLAREKSPYLLQHAHNPVNWYPWGQEALGRARSEGKIIFLSIGYSTCHWCHVMEKESFENPEVAQLLNQDFISIKVDREERQDLDQIYMTAEQAMTGSGGWPLNIFLTPDG